ncbi:MAG TPA: hypothetical protein DIW41_01965, partial [Lachnospiraceae bacterium]|nr:hypothetical protein [Lachnospiraceae bacterium]
GDEIDSIRTFEVSSQRSIEQVEELVIYPAAEIIPDANRIQEGLQKLEEEKKQYVKKLREQFKTEESARIQN